MNNQTTSENNIWKEKEARSNSKQHCNKIDQGLRTFDNTSAPRAIWELVQNARDLARVNHLTQKKECEIAITLTPDEFIFAHKGKPFTFDSLNSLVKQVSSEEKEDETEEAAGQFGTGFITTHSFGRRILIDASMSMQDLGSDKFVNIDSFEIDRTYDTIPQFIDKMAKQIVNIFEFEHKEQTTECREWTKFRYQLDSAGGALQKASDGIKAAINVMPYVMTINDRITHVELHDKVNNYDIVYKKEPLKDENGLKVMAIHIEHNGELSTKKVYYLQSTDSKDIVILPLKDATHAESLQGIAKLFLYFPLLGTEDFGMDCIFHSQRFFPEEARNGILLPKDNDNIKKQYEINTQILNDLSDMYFSYMAEHISNIQGMAEVSELCFKMQSEHRETDEFMTTFKKKWTDNFSSYAMIESLSGKNSIASNLVKVYDSTILNLLIDNPDYNQVIYDYARIATNLPSDNEVIKWSKVVESWGLTTTNHLLSLTDIASSITELQDKSKHYAFLNVIKDGGQSQIFRDYKLLPNREGHLQTSVILRDAKDIPTALYSVVKELVPEITSKFVDVEFADIEKLSSFDRKQLRDTLTSRLEEYSKEYLDNKNTYPQSVITTLVHLCGFYKNEDSISVRKTVMPLIAKFVQVPYTIQLLPQLSPDEPDLTENAFKHLIRTCLLKISQLDSEWVKENEQLLYDILAALHSWASFYSANNKSGYIYQYGVFPNEKGELHLATELKKNNGIDSELVHLVKRGLNRDLCAEFVASRFDSLFDFTELSAKEIGLEIERAQDENELPKDVIIDIIDHLDKGIWKDILSNIDKNKAEIFFKQVNEEKKDSVYRIMKVTDPYLLEEMADLADNPNAADIIAQIKNEIIKQQQLQADFQFKYAIGKYIEDTIRAKVSEELYSQLSVQVDDNQYGQDMIITGDNGREYFVEVKSKWNFNEPAHMSSLQMKKAIANHKNYTLCCIDLTNYNISDDIPMEIILQNMYAHTNIGCELGSLMSGITETDSQDVETTIQMEGSYRCNIPKKVFVKGEPFEKMVDEIIKYLTA